MNVSGIIMLNKQLNISEIYWTESWIYLEYIEETIEYIWNIPSKQLNVSGINVEQTIVYIWNILNRELNISGIYWGNNCIYLEYIEQTIEYILDKQFCLLLNVMFFLHNSKANWTELESS